jgi:hypothetical protein
MFLSLSFYRKDTIYPTYFWLYTYFSNPSPILPEPFLYFLCSVLADNHIPGLLTTQENKLL